MVGINTTVEEPYYEIEVSGEVDASSSIHLDEAIQKASEQHKKILIDLSKLGYISSAGLGVFISYIDDFKKKDIRLALFGLNEKVAQVFEILGLNELIIICSTKDEAKEKINAA
ncbi:MAG: STAS domain-containing protein [Cyclobacteriaceae bacterium]|nr:STAS domain-containing protein [Cyclobacteriaceae bacterium HetDA_MAG_MS6]